MKITGEHLFDAPRQVVWQAVLDPEVLTKVLPGCEDFHRTGAPDEHRFAGILKIKVGPVQGKFKGDVTLTDLEPPTSYRLSLKGRGAPGFIDGDGSLRLDDAADGGTRLRYDIDAKVGGRIASVGQRLLDSTSKVVTRQALEGLDEQVRLRADVAEAESEGASARAEAARLRVAESKAPSQSVFAWKMTRGMVEELVGDDKRATALAGVAAAVLVVILLLFKGC